MSQKQPRPVFVLRGSTCPINCVTFLSPSDTVENEQYLAGGTQEGEIIIWNLKTKGIHQRWKAHESSTLYVDSPKAHFLWSQGRTEFAALWDIECTTPIVIFKIDLKEYLGFCRIRILSNETFHLIASPGPGSSEFTIHEGNTHSKICSITPPDEQAKGMIMCLKWIKIGTLFMILAAYESGFLCLWDWSNAKIMSEIEIKDTPMAFEYNRSLNKGVCCTASEKIFSFAIRNIHDLCLDSEFCLTNPGTSSCVSRRDNKIYATGGWDNRIRIFTWKKHKPLAVLLYHKKTVECVQFSRGPVGNLSSGFLLAAGASDNSISLWDIFN